MLWLSRLGRRSATRQSRASPLPYQSSATALRAIQEGYSMRSKGLWVAAACVLGMTPGTLHAQEFNIGKVPVQVHGFMSQGVMKSNDNNFLTMQTKDGSAAMT